MAKILKTITLTNEQYSDLRGGLIPEREMIATLTELTLQLMSRCREQRELAWDTVYRLAGTTKAENRVVVDWVNHCLLVYEKPQPDTRDGDEGLVWEIQKP